MSRTIPIFHCFDHGYVLPAAVAFRALLDHAKSPDTTYAIYVVGRDLTADDRAELGKIVAPFPQATLTFLSAPEPAPFVRAALDSPTWNSAFTADLFNKLAVPELLPGHDLVIVADVDVVYADDIAKVYDYAAADRDFYVAGGPDQAYAGWKGEGLYPAKRRKIAEYFRLYSEEERRRLVLNAGLMVFNNAALNRDGVPARWREWAVANAARLILPEQDIINEVCYPKLKRLPWNFMAMAPSYGDYVKMSAAARAKNPVWDAMYTSPVQIHFASSRKPWKEPSVPLAERWFAVLDEIGKRAEWNAARAEAAANGALGPVDLVILWCDGACPAFAAKRRATAKKIGLVVKEGDNGACRYESHDELRYALRSVAKNLPWVRTVHLVVDDDMALPAWLDEGAPKLRVHRWGAIMPAWALPCFNSSVLEFFISDIPGLSERFLYANDDMLVVRPAAPGFFFDAKGRPILRYSKSRLDMEAPSLEDGFLHRVRESHRFIAKNFGVKGDYAKAYGRQSHHNIDPYLKSELLRFRERFPELWKHQVSFPFRDRSQLQREVYSGFMLARGKAVFREAVRPWYETLFGRPHRDSWTTAPGRKDIWKSFSRIKPTLLCVNDCPGQTAEDHARADRFMQTLFPTASGFERKI